MKPLRKNYGSLTLFALAVFACSCARPPTPEIYEPAWTRDKQPGMRTCDERGTMFSVIKRPTFEGAIVPTEYMGDPPGEVWTSGRSLGFAVESFWRPSEDDVSRAEARIREVFSSNPIPLQALVGTIALSPEQRGYELREIAKIVAHFGEYRRQYMGVVVSGRRRVLCNFFMKEPEDRPFIGDRWRCDWVAVDDGGFWYWQIQFDVEDDTCTEFRSNGYA